MDLTLIIFVVTFVVLMAVGMPVAYAVGLTAVVVTAFADFSLDGLIITIFHSTDNVNLLTIPFFVFAGAIMAATVLNQAISTVILQ